MTSINKLKIKLFILKLSPEGDSLYLLLYPCFYCWILLELFCMTLTYTLVIFNMGIKHRNSIYMTENKSRTSAFKKIQTLYVNDFDNFYWKICNLE